MNYLTDVLGSAVDAVNNDEWGKDSEKEYNQPKTLSEVIIKGKKKVVPVVKSWFDSNGWIVILFVVVVVGLLVHITKKK